LGILATVLLALALSAGCGDPELVGNTGADVASETLSSDAIVDTAPGDALSADAPTVDVVSPDAVSDAADDAAAVDVVTDVPEPCVPTCGDLPSRLSATRYPIVLAHGAGGWDNVGPVEYWWNVASHLEGFGYGVYTGQVDPFNSSAVRGGQLANFIDQVLACTCAQKVNLVAHSQGGIDSRYVVSSLGYGDRVASVTTIATPHYGTPIAEASAQVAAGQFVPGFTDDIINWVLFFVGDVLNDPFENPDFLAQLDNLSVSGMEQFNIDNPDDPRVTYYSWAGRAGLTELGLEECADGEVPNPTGEINPMFGLLLPMWTLNGGLEGVANDGLVTVESSKWGRFRGCLPADHLAEIGHPLSFTSGFDYLKFFVELAEFIEDEGF